MGFVNYMSTHLTLGGGLLASMLHGPLYIWIAANLAFFHQIEPWHLVGFAFGYLSAISAAAVSGTEHLRRWTLLTMLVYWPLQSWRMLWALGEMRFRPHFWAKTQHGISPAADASPPPPSDDNVIQLEFAFSGVADAATRQLAGLR